MKKTSFDNRVAILADYWYTYQDDAEEKEFFEFHDLGLPLAYMLDYGFIDKGYVENSPAEELINETFELLLKHWGKPEDIGYDDLDEIVGAQETPLENGEELARKIIEAALNSKRK